MLTDTMDQQNTEGQRTPREGTPTLSMSLRSTCKHSHCEAHPGMDFSRLSPSRNFGRSRHSRSPSVRKELHHRHHHSKSDSSFDSHDDDEVTSTKILLEKEDHVEEQRQESSIITRKQAVVSSTSIVEEATAKSDCRLEARRSYSDYSSGLDASDIDVEDSKTDYTYARSDTYRSKVTPGRQCITPNMSRSRIRRWTKNKQTISYSNSSDSDDTIIYHIRDPNSPLSPSQSHGDKRMAFLINQGQFSLSSIKRAIFSGQSGHSVRHGYGLDSDSSDTEEDAVKIKAGLTRSRFSQLLHLLYLHKILGWGTSIVRLLWNVIWKTVYYAVSYILLLDTWILSLVSRFGRKNLFKVLLPLFLLLFLWLLYGQQLPEQSAKTFSSLVSITTSSLSSTMALWSWPFAPKPSEGVIHTSVFVQDVNRHSDSRTSWAEFLSSRFSAIFSRWWSKDDQSSLHERDAPAATCLSMDGADIQLLVHKEISAWMAKLRREEDSSAKMGDRSELQSLTRTEIEFMIQDLLHKELAVWIQQQKQMQEVVEQQGHQQDQQALQLTKLGTQIQGLLLQSQNISEELVQLRHQLWSHKSNEDAANLRMAAILQYLQELERNFTLKIQTLQESLMSLKKCCLNRDDLSTVSEARLASVLLKVMNVTASSTQFSSSKDTCPSQEDVRRIVREALFLYDADKTGLVDYALETAGGTVINTRCSETYPAGVAQISIFGIPVWYSTNSPRTVIQPEVHPGQCWAFKGTQGYLVIQLSAKIHPTAISLEHIPKSLSPTGTIDSAPKEFSVLGLQHGTDLDGVLLGRYVYDQDGDPLQYFDIHESVPGTYDVVELQIHSNHGNMEYTCLYRFRVHGIRV